MAVCPKCGSERFKPGPGRPGIWGRHRLVPVVCALCEHKMGHGIEASLPAFDPPRGELRSSNYSPTPRRSPEQPPQEPATRDFPLGEIEGLNEFGTGASTESIEPAEPEPASSQHPEPGDVGPVDERDATIGGAPCARCGSTDFQDASRTPVDLGGQLHVLVECARCRFMPGYGLQSALPLYIPYVPVREETYLLEEGGETALDDHSHERGPSVPERPSVPAEEPPPPLGLMCPRCGGGDFKGVEAHPIVVRGEQLVHVECIACGYCPGFGLVKSLPGWTPQRAPNRTGDWTRSYRCLNCGHDTFEGFPGSERIISGIPVVRVRCIRCGAAVRGYGATAHLPGFVSITGVVSRVDSQPVPPPLRQTAPPSARPAQQAPSVPSGTIWERETRARIAYARRRRWERRFLKGLAALTILAAVWAFFDLGGGAWLGGRFAVGDAGDPLNSGPTLSPPTSVPTPFPTPQPTPSSSVAIATLTLDAEPAAPAIGGPLSGAEVAQLRLFALTLINADRADHGLPPVVLGTNTAAQLHAEDMLTGQYIGHWWRDGRKPYMVYSETGGTSYIAENAATSGWRDEQWSAQNCDGLFVNCQVTPIVQAIENLEWAMMYDDAHADWGHRDNILGESHRAVNIGIASNGRLHTFVQHFEGGDVVANQPFAVSRSGRVTLNLRKVAAGVDIGDALFLYYEPLPVSRSPAEIDTLHSYCVGGGFTESCGEPIARILAPPPAGTYYPDLESSDFVASTWQETASGLTAIADLGGLAARAGVYTIVAYRDGGGTLFTEVLVELSAYQRP
jgi:hypothetical protein